jgi:hypothetical protein
VRAYLRHNRTRYDEKIFKAEAENFSLDPETHHELKEEAHRAAEKFLDKQRWNGGAT